MPIALTDFMPGHIAALLRDAVHDQHQSVLIVGPAQSGKTTMLQLLVNELRDWARNRHVAAVHSCQRLHTHTAAGPAVSWSTTWLYRADPWSPLSKEDS